MKVRALVNFAGIITMKKGDEIEINDKEIYEDLIQAGFVEEVKPSKKVKKMKISDVSIEDIKQYANIYHNEDDNLISSILTAAKSYIKNYTGLSEEQMDQKKI